MIKNVILNLTKKNLITKNIKNIAKLSKISILLNTQKRYFSSDISNDNKYKSLMNELNFESDEEKNLRFEDQIFFLDREMKKLIKDKIKYGQEYGTQDFPEYQQRELNCLVEIVNNFDSVEKDYFFVVLKNYLDTCTNSVLYKQNSIIQDHNVKINFDLANLNPNNKILDEILTPLIPFLTSEVFVGSGSGSASNNEVAKETIEKKEEIKEEKKEVINFYYLFYFIFIERII
jgi:hypothetical protein